MHPNRGFTLIELMIVLAIVALLAAIAVPAFNEQMNKGRRTEAKSLLLRVASDQERFYTSNFTYAANLSELGYSSDSPASESGYYTATAAIANGGQTYTLTATPIIADERCENFTLASSGTRGVSGSEPVDYCW